uniref:Mother of FT n=1 Tax=Anemia villosa TaxID=148560 RepID=A0A8E7IM65_9MONI|nr:mother of FT [Anemia villosa]
MSSRRTESLVVGRVIGDVIDMFVPGGVDMTVSYGGRQVSNGCELKPSATAERPCVRLSIAATPASVGAKFSHHHHHTYDPDTYFTLVMVDPDAPSPSEPTMREWLHWIVTDIPATQGTVISSDGIKGNEMVPYEGPRPTVGIHRYVLVLFRQSAGWCWGGVNVMKMQMWARSRHNFCTRLFAAELGLGLPEAALYFNAQKEPATRKR